MLSSESRLAISHGYLILYVYYRNHWLFLFYLKIESKLKNIKIQWLPTDKVCDCYILTVKQPGSVLSLAIRDWLYLHPPTSPVWHKASRVHWWRSRGCQWVSFLLVTSLYLSSSSSQARHGSHAWGRVTLLCASERGELAVMGILCPELHSTAAKYFNKNPFQNCRPVMGKRVADNWEGTEKVCCLWSISDRILGIESDEESGKSELSHGNTSCISKGFLVSCSHVLNKPVWDILPRKVG